MRPSRLRLRCPESAQPFVLDSPNSVDTLRVLVVSVKHRAWIEWATNSRLPKSSTCISTAQAREIWVAAAGACRDCALVVAPRAFSHTAATFRGRRRGGNLVLWWSKLDFFMTAARDRSGFASNCRFLTRCRTLDVIRWTLHLYIVEYISLNITYNFTIQ